MVVDASILLAIFFKEAHSQWAANQLNAHATELCMSTVNLAEVLIQSQDRQPKLFPELKKNLLDGNIRFVPPDVFQAQIAAEARLKYPLNLGDCFVYALAISEDSSILTLDRDFRAVDRPVILPPK